MDCVLGILCMLGTCAMLGIVGNVVMRRIVGMLGTLGIRGILGTFGICVFLFSLFASRSNCQACFNVLGWYAEYA